MFCDYCGKQIPDGVRTCPKCGHVLDIPTISHVPGAAGIPNAGGVAPGKPNVVVPPVSVPAGGSPLDHTQQQQVNLHPGSGQPAGNGPLPQPANQGNSRNQASGQRPAGNPRPGNGNRPSGNQPNGNRPNGNRPSGNRPNGNRPSGNQPGGNRSNWNLQNGNLQNGAQNRGNGYQESYEPGYGNGQGNGQGNSGGSGGNRNGLIGVIVGLAVVAFVFLLVIVAMVSGKGDGGGGQTNAVAAETSKERAVEATSESEATEKETIPVPATTFPETTPAPVLEPSIPPTTAVPTTAFVTASDVTYQLFNTPVNLNGLQKVVVSSCGSTSTIYQKGYKNGPDMAVDGNQVTSWQEGVTGSGIGETIYYKLDRRYQMTAVTFKLGNWRSDSYFYSNNRPRTLKVTINDFVTDVTFPSDKTEYTMVLSPAYAADYIQFQIVDVYRGSKYDDTCIAEIGMYGTPVN